MFKKVKNQKGFTLIELIVVIAILGIIALIALPRFQDIQARSAINADAATAKQIISAARIVETEQGITPGDAIVDDTNGVKWNTGVTDGEKYMKLTGLTPQSGGAFAVTHDDTNGEYTITWTPTGGEAQSYVEGKGLNPTS